MSFAVARLRAALAAEPPQRGPSAEASARAEFRDDAEPPQPPQPPSADQEALNVMAEIQTELRERAEAAEARIAELEARYQLALDSTVGASQRAKKAEKRIAELEAFADKVDKIRDSFVARQTLNWSMHAYPLVRALNEIGRSSLGYDEARARAEEENKAIYAEVRAELQAAAKPPSDAEIEAWLDDFREVLIVEWGDSMPKSVSDVAASAVALMRRHDDRLERLREWVENEMRNDSWWRPVILAKIADLLAETKGGSDG